MSRYGKVEQAPPIEVFNVGRLCTECTDPDKVNLGVGAYRDEEGKPWVLPVVRAAEKKLAADDTLNHEYLPVLGFEPFTTAAVKLVLGPEHKVVKEGRVFGVQCLSGTGSLRMGAEFLAKKLGSRVVYCSKPTWGNHRDVFREAGFTEIKDYTYWDQANRKLNYEGFIADLSAAPEGAVIILHGCAHNPTGIDPTKEQWQGVLKVVQEKKLVPLFDIAYQGFASGNPDEDAWAVRMFADAGLELFVAQSFAKNFGLYNERVGNLVVVVNDPAVIAPVKSQITLLVRAMWSNPPAHGAKIVHMVLTDPEMLKQWHEQVQVMANRIKKMRAELRANLEKLGTPGTWDHVTTQIGMFSFLGISEAQSLYMRDKHNIFLLKSGRISCCGLTSKNVEKVAKAIDDAVRNAAKM